MVRISLSLSHTHTHSLSLFHFLSHTRFSHTHTYTHSLSHTLCLTHTLSFSLSGTKLQSEVSILLTEKSITEESVELVLKEIADFEAYVRRLEKEMLELSRIESDAKGVLDEAGKNELRNQKIRLDREFGGMLVKIGDRKERLKVFEEKLQALDRARQVKESELSDLERKLVVLLEEQQNELDQIKIRQEKRMERKIDSLYIKKSTNHNGGGGGSHSSSEGKGGYQGPTPAQKKEAEQLMNSTETLMKFGFMSMSMTYFSSLNMIRAIKAVGAIDTNIEAAMANSIQNGTPFKPPIPGMKSNQEITDAHHSSTALVEKKIYPSASEFQPSLKGGEFVKNTDIEVHRWSVEDVCDWVATLSLSQYREAFQDASIDGPFLYDINDEDLRNVLGIEHGLHRKKIMNSIKRLRQIDTGKGGLAQQESIAVRNITNPVLQSALGQKMTIAGVTSAGLSRSDSMISMSQEQSTLTRKKSTLSNGILFRVFHVCSIIIFIIIVI